MTKGLPGSKVIVAKTKNRKKYFSSKELQQTVAETSFRSFNYVCQD